VPDEPLETLLQQMRAGDLRAAEQVLLAHEPLLRLIVRRHLSRRLRAKFDSLDVVQSVWVRVLRDFRQGGCRLDSTAHLRNFLVRLTRNCLTDRFRHYRTSLAHEQVLGEDGPAELKAAGQPRPSEVAQANELWRNLLAVCPPEHHELLRLRQQGLPLAVVAARTGLHEGSVRRILRQLARKVAFPAEALTA
jgi:RNA polymerase sigma-70 factor (ECF subfamily)